jgi:uncharacterized repeat protein (TIGR03806 family)
MMNKHFWVFSSLILGLIVWLAMLPAAYPDQADAPLARLSEYGFFEGDLRDLKPAAGVFGYEVNAPLFSDHAEKARFIRLPAGQTMKYDTAGAWGFPEGSVIIKNFYYPHDEAHHEAGRRIMETRLLVRQPNGWKALEYVWNAEQTDANLEVAGMTLPVEWRTAAGTAQKLNYLVPNLNQCKGCHSFDGQFTPIGVTTRQLNRGEGADNQIMQWAAAGRIQLPEGFDPAQAERLADYRVAQSSTEAAARAYLDGNCAHCHNEHGPASTSGLYLTATETRPERLGVRKPPVAAGRGSGQRKYSIVPGQPDESILVYRMESNDPGIRMPEIGRQVAHDEGLRIIKEWIRTMR